MSSPTWQRVFAIFEEAVELPLDDRAAFLDGACDTPEIRAMVEDLLAADAGDETSPFADHLDRPLIDRPLEGGGTEREEARGKSSSPGPLSGPVGIPRILGAYRILRQVGQGGMSTVYLAVRADDAFRRRVVVKVVRRGMESENLLRRLRTERQILASLDHPYVARLYDGGSTDSGLPYFVMEYVEGCSIDEYCETNDLSVAERLTLFRKVCSAVHYAHQNLVIHRDIKPSNILVTAAGDPKLLDFGIARLLNPELISAEVEPTASWQRVMTPSYASPEQIRGRQVTTASDVYSLGVLLYQMLTGRLPRDFQGLTQSEIERLLAETEPVRPSLAKPSEATASPQSRVLQKELTGDLDAIVLKPLRTAAARRYSSVEQMDTDLGRFQQGLPVEARAGTWLYRAGKFVRRHRAAVTVLTAVAVLLVGFAVAMGLQSARVARERDAARLERDKKQQVLELIQDIFLFSNPYVLPGEELTVREALSRSVPVLETGLEDQPAVRAELLHTSGSILTILGEYRTAKHQLEEALEIRRNLYGEAHRDVIRTQSLLAENKKELGELEEAEALALRAVESAKGLQPKDGTVGDEETLVLALNALVSVRCHGSQHGAAADPAEEALALARRLPSGEHETLALEYLALIKTALGEYAAAEPLYREALALRRQRYGARHPVLLSPLNNLGVVLRRGERFAEAEKIYKDLLELQRESFGEDYRDPFLLGNLAGLYFGQENYPQAIAWFNRALEAVRESSGPEHWMVFVFELDILEARVRSGEAFEAETPIRRLLEEWLPRQGDDHWRMAEGRGVLGESLSTQGKCEEAEWLLTASFERLMKVSRKRRVEDALERLRRHVDRCGGEIGPYEARVAARE